MRRPREHFQGAHGAQSPVDQERHIIGFDRAGIPGFYNNRRLSTERSRVVKIPAGPKIGWAVVPNNDVIKAERENHLLRDLVLRVFARGSPVSVGPEALVEVAAVIVDQVVRAIHDLFGDEEGSAVRLRSIGFAWVEAVHALVIYRIDVRDLLFERSNVDQRNQDDRARNLSWVEINDQSFDGNHGNVLRPMRTGHQCKYRTRFSAIYHDDENGVSGIA